MALTAIIAMLHDVVVSVGIYSIFGFEVTPATVVAFLTVLGYSLYDSIVVFDRIRDNERRVVAAGMTAGDLINVSTNQVLMRSINTTLASALPGDLAAADRCRAVRPGDAARVRHRPAGRDAHRCVLVDLPRLAAARAAEGPVGHVRRARLVARRSPAAARICAPSSSPVPAACARCRGGVAAGAPRRRGRIRPPERRCGRPGRHGGARRAGAGRPPADPPAAAAQEEAPVRPTAEPSGEGPDVVTRSSGGARGAEPRCDR